VGPQEGQGLRPLLERPAESRGIILNVGSVVESGEFRSVCHGDVELRFCLPIAWDVIAGPREGTYTCVLREAALATRLRERLNFGRGATPAGAVKSLQRKLLKLVLGTSCPGVLASLVDRVGPREHDSRVPVTEMLKLALLAQWLVIEERRGRVYNEVTIRQEPTEEACLVAPSFRLDLVLLEPPQGESPLRLTAVEVKSSRSDFTGDHKWHNYIGRADRLYFATPPGIIKPHELPQGVGLLELQKPGDGDLLRKVAHADDFEVSLSNRADLLYGLATCDRLHDGGLDLLERARLQVAEFWNKRSKKIKKAPDEVLVPSV
jgi:hypothetical protein